MKLRSILLGTALSAAFAGAAIAKDNDGWYVGVEAGANWVEDVDDDYNGLFGPTQLDTEFDTGWTVLATVGYAFHNNWRAELEAGFRSNDLNSAVNSTGFPFHSDGSFDEITLMANVLYDIHLTERLDLSLGVGVGVDRADYEAQGIAFEVDDQDWSFAYQGIVGLSYAIGERTDLTLTYRYFNATDLDFQSEVPIFEHNFDDVQKHTVTIGLRFDLGEPEEFVPPAPPGPPVPPAPPGPKQYIVFFGFNKANLTAEAHAVVKEAAAAAKEFGSAQILVVGHTDTVGSHGYNQKLSLRRAFAVKAGLIDEGIPEGAISTTGRGETELLVQTADGVKEPQNRRATIDLD